MIAEGGLSVCMNNYITDLDEGIEGGTHQICRRNQADRNSQQPRTKIQMDLNKLERWALSNKVKFR